MGKKGVPTLQSWLVTIEVFADILDLTVATLAPISSNNSAIWIASTDVMFCSMIPRLSTMVLDFDRLSSVTSLTSLITGTFHLLPISLSTTSTNSSG